MLYVICGSNFSSSASYFIVNIATSCKAYCDHGCTQIGDVQDTKDGKFLSLYLNFSPIGDKQSTICKLVLHLLTKYSHNCIVL